MRRRTRGTAYVKKAIASKRQCESREASSAGICRRQSRRSESSDAGTTSLLRSMTLRRSGMFGLMLSTVSVASKQAGRPAGQEGAFATQARVSREKIAREGRGHRNVVPHAGAVRVYVGQERLCAVPEGPQV